ncbi:MAG: carbohydrate binding domain-containing protein, partial [Oscillospiraceae bacterium]|nr:carbohydrate binding domain-containing protein [Oscillospiraceae bacterium]
MTQNISDTCTPQTAEKSTRIIKKTPKIFKAAISLVLCLVMFVEMIPPELVWAASDALVSESDLAASETVPYENTILFEDPSLREENKKEYRMSDGSYKAIVYPQPIHYQENGQWQDIDNTLTLDESAGGYTNAASDFSVTFAKKSSSKKLVEIKTDDYKLSWGFVGSNDNKSAKKKTKVTSDDITALDELSDGLYYNDIYNDVDVEYLLQSKTIKENIILKTKEAQQSFELELKLNKATAVLNSDRTVSIILSDGTEAAKFSAPFMYDAKGVQSTDVAVSLSGSGNKYTLTLTPSKEWLNAEDRAYPVTIDPVVTHSRYNAFSEGFSKSFLLDGYLSGENYYVGKYYNSNQNTVDEVYSFWYVFSEFWYESEIRNAYLCVDTAPRNSSMWTGETYNNVTINKSISAHAVSVPFESLEDKENVSISQPFDIVDVSVDYSTTNSNTPTVCKFDITEYIYSDFFDNTDRFLILQEYDPPATVTSGTLPIMFTNARVEFDYRSPTGVEEYLTYTEASVGEAGTIYINDATGHVVFAHSGLTTPSVTMPISVGNVYQGNNWRTNFSETLYKYNSVEEVSSLTEYVDKTYAEAGYPYSWVDSDGTTIYFHKDKELDENGNEVDVIVDETGKRIKLTELSNGNVQLKDAEENISVFAPYADNQYRLVRKTDAYGNSIYVSYRSSDSTQIYDFTNDYGERIAIGYNENGKPECMVELIECEEVAQQIDFSYDSAGNLTQITRDDGKKTILSYSGTTLTGVLDAATGYMVKLVYEGNKITLKEYANVPETMDLTDASEGQSMVMTFNGDSTSFRTPGVNGIMEDSENSDDILTVYQFDTYLRTVSAYSKSYVGNEFYGAEQQEYTSGGLVFSGNDATNGDQKYGFNKIKSTVSVGKATENLLANGNFEQSLPSGNNNPADFCGAQFDCNEAVTGGGELYEYITSAIYSASETESVLSGNKALKTKITEAGTDLRSWWNVPIAHSNSLKPNTEYTFSAYVRKENSSELGGRLTVKIGTTEHTSGFPFASASNSEWERLEVHFTTPSTLAEEVKFYFANISSNYVYIDCVQLEEGAAANAYNYADNQNFEATYTDSANAVVPFFWNGNGAINTNGTCFGNNAIAVEGNVSSDKTVTQTITLGNRYNAPQSRDITISAWAKADALPKAEHTPNRFFGIKARLVYAEAEGNTSYSEIEQSSFNYFVADWQFASLSLSSDETKTLLAVELTLAYNCQIGTCLFDNVSVADNTVTNYEYDGLGNLTRIKAGDEETVNDYDEMQLVSSTDLNKD